MPLPEATVARIRGLVNAEYEEDAFDLIDSRQWWNLSRNAFDALSQVASGVGTLLAFAAGSGYVPKESGVAAALSFGAGASGTVSLVLQVFSNYSDKTARQRVRDLNAILSHADITPVPQASNPGQTPSSREESRRISVENIPTSPFQMEAADSV